MDRQIQGYRKRYCVLCYWYPLLRRLVTGARVARVAIASTRRRRASPQQRPSGTVRVIAEPTPNPWRDPSLPVPSFFSASTPGRFPDTPIPPFPSQQFFRLVSGFVSPPDSLQTTSLSVLVFFYRLVTAYPQATEGSIDKPTLSSLDHPPCRGSQWLAGRPAVSRPVPSCLLSPPEENRIRLASKQHNRERGGNRRCKLSSPEHHRCFRLWPTSGRHRKWLRRPPTPPSLEVARLPPTPHLARRSALVRPCPAAFPPARPYPTARQPPRAPTSGSLWVAMPRPSRDSRQRATAIRTALWARGYGHGSRPAAWRLGTRGAPAGGGVTCARKALTSPPAPALGRAC